MAFVIWDTTLDVGVSHFNEDHRRLVGFINDLHGGIVSGLGISQMTYILDGLIDYTKNHFAREEDLMAKHEYPDIKAHRREHYDLMKQVAEFSARLREGKASFSLELMSFLKDWLVNHIKGTDMKYRDFFSAKGLS
ncbi:MAG TPA: bacteriohemerythrin [Spirochaetota bacterium]|nr:bacteriohemerythrin [Spirochaetota bacterium]HPL15391.1 bacteriohemerythrin [Spirochaetota bacterium]HQF08300.1 bacteriohemerythrin [Spirochaetota bacterium]HQH97085.1 bacteriohemerythrin [Spirochaetota bacterium]HQJ69995.1 bacteriohemerythrin [Spirochaetota bacterium]